MESILFISLMNGDSWGGSEELWYATALYATRCNYKVGCMVYDDEAKKLKLTSLENAGAKMYWIPNRGKLKKSFREKIENKVNKKITIPAFLKTVPFQNYDHVLVNQGEFELAYSTWQTLWKRFNDYSLLFHNYREDQKIAAAGLARLKTWTQNASTNFFASARICILLEQQMNQKIGNAEVLINPITFTPPPAAKPWPTLHNSNYIFISVAALHTARKAQDILIVSFAAAQWRNRNWELHLYGEGIDKEKLRALIQHHGLEDRVFLKGYANNVEQVLTTAHVLCQMTKMDAMPISVVEALACGRPVLATAVGDMPDWVEDGVNGFLCTNAAVDHVTNTLEKAWAVRDEWPQMGVAAFKTFEKKYPKNPPQFFLQKITDWKNQD